MKASTSVALTFAALTALGGCAYKGGDIGDPLHRKFHWFSFIGGEDIAATCAADTPDRARLVYNAVWGQQTRIYEWDSLRRSLRIRVVGGGNLTALSLSDPLAPWRAEETKATLDQAGLNALNAALDAAGGFGPAAIGLELPSHAYYWTAATCRGGKFTFTGWLYPSDRFEAARFPAALFALDPDRQSVISPAPIPFDPIRNFDQKRGATGEFTLKVGVKGLGR
ncbi:conserved hypothetical protein [Candidatus Terasakiella magnetica]|nr:conserved hypothetical protein [Candidatus Terasakiella magnetica]